MKYTIVMTGHILEIGLLSFLPGDTFCVYTYYLSTLNVILFVYPALSVYYIFKILRVASESP